MREGPHLQAGARRGSRQRERLLAAMVQAAARHGYGGASVARVVERAGVSRATFYEHFVDREDCFLAAYREVSSRIGASVGEAARRSAPPERPRAVLTALLAEATADPAGARLVLIEAMAAGPAVRVEHERLIAETEAAAEHYLAENRGGAPQLEIPPAALLGGVGGILSMRLFNGQDVGLDSLRDELLAWVDSHALPAGQARLSEAGWGRLGRGLNRPLPGSGDSVQPALPRGRAALPPTQAAERRRRRILSATARMVREKGYSNLTVADVVASARVTRGAFYSHFRGKEDAFLATQTLSLEESVAAAAARFFVGCGWPERVWAGLAALFGYLAEHPDRSHLGIVEVYAAGEAAIHRSYDSRMAYALFLEDGYRQAPESGPIPRLCSDAIAGAIYAIMRRHVVEDRTTELLEALPQAVYTALAPFVGPSDALSFVRTKAGEAR